VISANVGEDGMRSRMEDARQGKGVQKIYKNIKQVMKVSYKFQKWNVD
jgi:hypothetical protein